MGCCFGERIWRVREGLLGIRSRTDVLRFEEDVQAIAHEFATRKGAWEKERDFIYGVYLVWQDKPLEEFVKWLVVANAYCFHLVGPYEIAAFFTVFYLLIRDEFPSGNNFF